MKRLSIMCLVITCATASAVSAFERTLPSGNPAQVEREIRSIPSFCGSGIQVYQTAGTAVLVYIDDLLCPMNLTQLQALQNVLSTHVPDFSAEIERLAFETEISSNNLCTANLQDIDIYINTFRDSVTADIAAATTVAQIKTVMTTMNTTYAAAFRKTARCVRARAR